MVLRRSERETLQRCIRARWSRLHLTGNPRKFREVVLLYCVLVLHVESNLRREREQGIICVSCSPDHEEDRLPYRLTLNLFYYHYNRSLLAEATINGARPTFER